MARLAFLGTPPVAARVLEALVTAGHDVRLVVSGPDRRRGRGGQVTSSPVKQRATELGLPVARHLSEVVDAGAELGVVVAFGQIVRPEVLDRLPMVNLHFSLLPRWRGAAPVERAILAGDPETGVCLMSLEEGLDTGPLHARASVSIGDEETADELRERLGLLGTSLLLDALAEGTGSLSAPIAQTGATTYAEKLRADELVVDWQRPAIDLARLVRVGRASTTFRGKRLLVRRARLVPDVGPAAGRGAAPGTVHDGRVTAGAGELELLEVQLEGRAVQPFSAFAQGARLELGEVLGR